MLQQAPFTSFETSFKTVLKVQGAAAVLSKFSSFTGVMHSVRVQNLKSLSRTSCCLLLPLSEVLCRGRLFSAPRASVTQAQLSIMFATCMSLLPWDSYVHFIPEESLWSTISQTDKLDYVAAKTGCCRRSKFYQQFFGEGISCRF